MTQRSVRRALARFESFVFDPPPAGESIWRAIFVTIVVIGTIDIVVAALRGRGWL